MVSYGFVYFELLFQQEDVMLHVFSFLNLQSLYNISVTNHFFNKMLSTQQADRSVYGPILFRVFSHFLQQNKIVKQDEFYKIIQRENVSFLNILKEFFTTPFKKQNYNSHAFYKYSNNGGVVDILLWKPCLLLNLIYQQYFNDIKDNLKITIFKYLLILSVNNEDNFYDIYPSFNLSFSLQPRPKQLLYTKTEIEYPILEKEYHLNPGQLLLHMSNDFNQLLINYCNKTNEFYDEENKDNNYLRPIIWNDYFELDYQLIGNQYTEAMGIDIFDQAIDPPYGLKQSDDEVNEMRNELYSSSALRGDCYSIDWKNCVDGMTCWSEYWLSGLDWWGTYGITTYNKKTKLFVVATASTTD
ncbi:hypothetical protein ABK040_004272 [Willaertia magna]